VQDALAAVLRRTSAPAAAHAEDTDDAGLGPNTAPSDPPEGAAESSRARLTAELASLPTGEITARWHSMIADLTRQVDAASARRPAGPAVRRARELADHAQALVASLERVKATAAEHQARVDHLEAQARAFRGSLGHAIDTLSRDRSRERANIESIAARRLGMERAALAIGAPESGEGDVLLWERATLETEAARARAAEADLGYQIEELQKRLDAQNERVDADLADASGQLEGALSALRRLTGELVRTMEEASSVLA
jgi:chromosome segregation ATPase